MLHCPLTAWPRRPIIEGMVDGAKLQGAQYAVSDTGERLYSEAYEKSSVAEETSPLKRALIFYLRLTKQPKGKETA